MRFITIFLHQLRTRTGQILGWGISLFILAAYLVSLHDAFLSQQEQFQSMVSAYPPEMMAMFGGASDLFSSSGFLDFTYFSYIIVLLGFLAIFLGTGLLTADEERGRLELLAAYPAGRLVIFFARLLAGLLALGLILVLSWLGFLVTIPGTGLATLSAGQLALPHLELLVFLIFWGGLGLLLSQLLPSRGAATGLASALLLASYVLKILLELDDKLAGVERLSPMHYVRGGYAIDGLEAGPLLGLLAFGLLFILLGAWRFDRRDLRLSGEGSWPAWLRLKKRTR